MTTERFLSVDSPIGRLTLIESDGALVRLDHGREGEASDTTPVLLEAAAQLRSYFDGERETFDLPLAPPATSRQKEIWAAMCNIPYGSWWSYQALANDIGSSARAVGGACAANPLPIFIPCHRVLNADGRLGKYSFADGPETKHQLLCLEGTML